MSGGKVASQVAQDNDQGPLFFLAQCLTAGRSASSEDGVPDSGTSPRDEVRM